MWDFCSLKHSCQEEILFFLEHEINTVPPRKIKSLEKRGVISGDKREILCNERFSTKGRNFLDVIRITAADYDISYWPITFSHNPCTFLMLTPFNW